MNNSYLIVGTNFINKGAEAMLKTVTHFIKKVDGNADIHLICHETEKEIALMQGFFPHFIEKTSTDVFFGKVEGKVKKVLGLKPKPYADYTPIESIKKIKNLKMAIDASGFAYGDKRGYQQPLETLLIIDYLKSIGVPFYFMPQAWGTFKDAEVAANCKLMLEKADGFYTRDDQSRAYVASLLQKKIDTIPLMPDIAFHFPIPSNDPESIYPGILKLANEKLIIGISPNMRVLERMGKADPSNSYVKILLETIQFLQKDYHVLLIPNEIRPPGDPNKDDAFLCELLFNLSASKENLHLVTGYRTAEEIKSIIKTCSFLIASRFHSLIFALSLGIPCVAISWSHKYRELFKLFELEHLVVEDKEMELPIIEQKVKNCLSNLDSLGLKLNEDLVNIKKRNISVFDVFKG
ncbi:polysaccharide pyruvyl transferase family protein [Mongoliitalea daihaiensis]|uniref:polysaccharide pyruvyl transferase family protein n=1 Tax=Mongoliitalea daihaiensis TaxID=2782006 RepID=UPI001F420F2C|nr:polysaccharide pyruvyl transferase family protein [Mongoliitalea daihaiensis]UJP64517.1 polysaccharide pyruvyl transferase family protein [Mongoliitalea daihaiensis]